ncbi:MAG: hypothetical protein ACLU4J_03660 [Butyricimonas paravirosa]
MMIVSDSTTARREYITQLSARTKIPSRKLTIPCVLLFIGFFKQDFANPTNECLYLRLQEIEDFDLGLRGESAWCY